MNVKIGHIKLYKAKKKKKKKIYIYMCVSGFRLKKTRYGRSE